jgi:hypothetical protein
MRVLVLNIVSHFRSLQTFEQRRAILHTSCLMLGTLYKVMTDQHTLK